MNVRNHSQFTSFIVILPALVFVIFAGLLMKHMLSLFPFSFFLIFHMLVCRVPGFLLTCNWSVAAWGDA